MLIYYLKYKNNLYTFSNLRFLRDAKLYLRTRSTYYLRCQLSPPPQKKMPPMYNYNNIKIHYIINVIYGKV